MPQLSHGVKNALLGLKSAVIIGGAIALFLTGKITEAAFVGIMAGFGALWTGVGGALVSMGRTAAAVTAPTPANVAGAPPAPVPPGGEKVAPSVPVIAHDARTEP